ncbi:MAG TPA: argininosuccinate lyase [Firmicutes bacterium]|nr:argininosuccinate lyase [Bacillota bacterium]
MKLWGGRFAKATDALVEVFTASIGFDRRLYRQDIQGSIAHTKMLVRQGILSPTEGEKIIAGLQEIAGEIERGQFTFTAAREDIHMHIEARLQEKIGPVAGKIHTARSRNDQVATDLHLYVKEETAAVLALIAELQGTILHLAEKHLGVIMPGYTHLQRAQPILFSHHLLAYFEMLERDWQRFRDCARRADSSPLGAGALAGTSFPIDRHYTASQMGFSSCYRNSVDAVSDRDFVLEFLAAAAILMQHLSRFCEELILWSSQEFAFIELDDAFTTGSSIMPQKKNPDVPELIRGKTGRVYGNLIALLTTMKGLPLAYNKDLQEDKEPLFDTVDTIKNCLTIFAPLLASLEVKEETMERAAAEGFANATDAADYLAKKGVPFREAHRVVGNIVRYCLEEEKGLADLTLEEFRRFSPVFGMDITGVIQTKSVVAARESYGGTAAGQVERALKEGWELLAQKQEKPGP